MVFIDENDIKCVETSQHHQGRNSKMEQSEEEAMSSSTLVEDMRKNQQIRLRRKRAHRRDKSGY
jgi:hypothetical protein